MKSKERQLFKQYKNSGVDNIIGDKVEISEIQCHLIQTQTDETSIKLETQYSLHPLRWWLQIFYAMGLLSDLFLMMGFSPVASVIADTFNCNKVIIDAQPFVYLIMFAPCNFLLLIGAVFTIIGCWLRMLVLISGNFYLMFPGNIHCGIAQVFFQNTGGRLATRALATAVGGLSLPIGCLMGFIVPVLFFGGNGNKQEAFKKYILAQNIIVTALSVPILIAAREKPPHPPSLSATRKEPKINLWKELRILLNNKSYLLLCCSLVLTHSLFTTLGAVISTITKPFGYKPIDNSIFGGVFIFFGLIGSVVFGILLDKYGKYKLTTNIISLVVSVAVALAFWTLPSQNIPLLTANIAVIGFFLTPMLSISYTFAVELTFPVPESISTGMMVMVAETYGSALVSNYLDLMNNLGHFDIFHNLQI
ncbi:UNKNOWN [Stylonychia lemnae]|uniref:Major facilitator superfamily protein n=1 Tax=Stylonychia lemnae TaxID=5949 RepID=A0A078AXT5_STYLE|nr:UNKNOWN [Stylonychia lemnae]|eukprot:CDW86047.1 UNKNOWN [Stylonychia lemnae]